MKKNEKGEFLIARIASDEIINHVQNDIGYSIQAVFKIDEYTTMEIPLMDLSFEKALFRKCGVNETVVVIKDERAANEIAHNLSVQHVASVFDIYIYGFARC